MSKNLTRKGLALGVALSLGTAAFAGTPAFAVSEIVTAPSAGTLLSTLSASSFTLKTDISVTAGTASKLKYKVTNADARSITTTSENASNGFTANTSVVKFDGTTSVDATSGTFTGTEAVITPAEAGTTAASNLLKISNGYRDADVTVTVQAWIDENSNGLVDGTEFAAAAQAIKFVKNSNVSATTTLKEPVLGAASLSADVVLTGINMQQVAARDVRVTFKKNGTAITSFAANTVVSGDITVVGAAIAAGTATTGNAANTSYASGKLSATFTPVNVTQDATGAVTASNADDALVVVAGSIYTAAASLYNGSTYDAVGTDQSYTPSAGTATVAPDVTLPVTKDTLASGKIRTATKSVTLSAAVYSSGTTSIGAGYPAVVRITKVGSLSTATGAVTSITAGGKTLTNDTTDGYIEFNATTDANGKVAIAIASNTGAAGDTLDVKVTVKSPTGYLDDTQRVNWANATLAATVVSLNDNAVQKVAIGGSYTLKYALKDDFGLSPKTGYRLKAVQTGLTGTDVVNVTRTAEFVNGIASLTVPVSAKATLGDSITNTLTVDAYTASTDSWGNDSSFNFTNNAAPTITVGTETAAKTIDVSASGTGTASTALESARYALNLKAFAASDARLGDADPTSHAGPTLSGTVKDQYGTGTYASTVTLSGANLMFSVGSAGTLVTKVGSITVATNANGAFSGVSVYSNLAGKQTVTVTSGSASKTIDLYFKKAAATSGVNWSYVGSTKLSSGSTLVAIATLTDAFGNVVDTTQTATGEANVTAPISIEYTGPGLVVPSTLPTTTDDTGKVSFRVILGNNEIGLASITYTNGGADGDIDSADTGDNANIAKSANVLIGVSASVSAGSKKANVVVKNAAGLTVKVVSGAKSTTKVATSDSYKVSLTKLTKGSKTVKVYVNDILVASKKVTVKK